MANGTFQGQVNINPTPGVAGDFASANPRIFLTAGPGGLKSDTNGVYIGRFAWIDPMTQLVNNSGLGVPDGFVANTLQGQITTWLDGASMLIPSGKPITLFSKGDFWALTSTVAQYGQKVYANLGTGEISCGTSGTPSTGATSTAGSVAASTFSVTASIAQTYDNLGQQNLTVMTVTAVGSGTVVPGATISGTGVVSGTKVLKQLTGTTGGVGTYEVDLSQNVTSTTVAGTYGTLTIGGTLTGTFAVGDVISGSGVVAGTTITALGTGTGGAGTYIVNDNTVVASTAITAYATVETPFYVRSFANAGEVVKISSWS